MNVMVTQYISSVIPQEVLAYISDQRLSYIKATQPVLKIFKAVSFRPYHVYKEIRKTLKANIPKSLAHSQQHEPHK